MSFLASRAQTGENMDRERFRERWLMIQPFVSGCSPSRRDFIDFAAGCHSFMRSLGSAYLGPDGHAGTRAKFWHVHPLGPYSLASVEASWP